MPGNPASYPKWITSINKSYGDRVQMTASQVHAMLKEKAKQRIRKMFFIVFIF